MANTYTQIHLQLVFAPKYRLALLGNLWREELHKYITGIVQNNRHKMLIVNSMPDHIHLFIGMRPHQSLSDLMQDVKGSSSQWINEKRFTNRKFGWQEGYGAFSYSHSHLQRVIEYIKNQSEHHKKKTFLEEYKAQLQAFSIEYDEKFILREPE